MVDPLAAPSHIGTILEKTRAEWFSYRPLQIAREVIARRWKASQPLDLPIIMAELTPVLDQQSAANVIDCLNDAAPLSPEAAKFWIEELERTHHRRTAHYAAYDLVQLASDPTTETAQLQNEVGKLSQALTTAKGFVERREWIARTIDQLEAAATRGTSLAGPSWGFNALDDATGGIQGGKLVVVAGPTGGGKSALAMHFALQCAKQGGPALFWSLEMPGEDMMLRMMANIGDVSALKAQRGVTTQAETDAILQASTEILDLPIEIIDEVLAFDDMLAVIRAQVQQRHLKMVVIDYIQIIPPSNRKHPSKERELAEMSSTLAKLSKDLDICVVALSQLNDDGALSQARAIGHDANLVLKMGGFDAGFAPPYNIETLVAKNRGGPRCEFVLEFDAPCYRFQQDHTK